MPIPAIPIYSSDLARTVISHPGLSIGNVILEISNAFSGYLALENRSHDPPDRFHTVSGS